MNAMTWWDHETESVWSQPWGLALRGPLKGARLNPVPANLVPWKTWKEEHPDTLALDTPRSLFGRGEPFNEEFVVGITVGENARAYHFKDIAAKEVLNDYLGNLPVLIFADPRTKAVKVYLREVEGKILIFEKRGDRLVDSETGSSWDLQRGIAMQGRLQSQGLKQVPYISAYDWAWLDFYPKTSFYKP